MLRALHDLGGLTITADDGDIGSIDAFLFDDRHWAVRHIVVDLGKWLPGRRVLLSPVLVATVGHKRVTVRTTKEKIRNSPDHPSWASCAASCSSTSRNYSVVRQ